MEMKVKISITALIVFILLAYFLIYVPYTNDLNDKNFNAGLQKASAIDLELDDAFLKITNYNSTDIHKNIIVTIKELNKSQSKIDEKIEILNNTRRYANGNITKEQYIDYELQLAQLEKVAVSEMLDEYKDFGDGYNATDVVKMMNASDQMVKTINTRSDDAAPIKDNLLKLLGDNPDFNKTLHDLNLYEDYYGDLNLTHVSL